MHQAHREKFLTHKDRIKEFIFKNANRLVIVALVVCAVLLGFYSLHSYKKQKELDLSITLSPHEKLMEDYATRQKEGNNDAKETALKAVLADEEALKKLGESNLGYEGGQRALYMLATFFYNEKNDEKALYYFQKILGGKKTLYTGYSLLFLASIKEATNPAEAVQFLERLRRDLKDFSLFDEAGLALARYYIQLKNFNEAEKLLSDIKTNGGEESKIEAKKLTAYLSLQKK